MDDGRSSLGCTLLGASGGGLLSRRGLSWSRLSGRPLLLTLLLLLLLLCERPRGEPKARSHARGREDADRSAHACGTCRN